MKNIFEHPIVRKIISFLISIIIVLIIFVGIVGILFPMILEARFEHVKVISLVSTLIGALIILISRRFRIMRFISFVKKPGDFDFKVYDYIGSVIIGAAFLIGGIVYMRTKNPVLFFIPFIAGFALIRILIFYVNRKAKARKSARMTTNS
ncbi:MAG: hypothetical protein JW927_16595 [Deltaproteobacteria bacterium]|nr:hypothetical protein [Deltaproteobacteria bacterium]